ncbi:unnamed protein product, partial [Nippostrongylus brasiliensis]|uniref:Homocysteine-responsive endoplasmic reticulum-resident ubiquitin-like domain member 2 protein n=1 Tax=Nippostrongylus brasiliensis TaxID=27835 RepID=A0A0N4XNW0_NIPBR
MMGQMGYAGALAQGAGASQPFGQPMQVPVAQALNRDAAAAGNQDDVNMPAEPNGLGGVPVGGRDVLDIIYRVFRVLLFLSAVLLYSSIERFLAVITIALFIFFIQLRRNHRRQARAAEPAEPNVNNNNTGEHPHENTETAQAAFVAPSPQSGLQIFFATCYS